jgi:Tol biopolymer transport system component
MAPLRDLLRLTPFLIAGATLACQGDTLIEPSLGTLEISTTTGGSEPDADGYTVRVDTEPVRVIASIGLVRTGVLEGQHNITLEGLAANCAVDGENPRQVTVPAADTTVVRFTVLCSSTVGTVVVTATTTGAFQPSSGFFITLDGAILRPLAPAGQETIYSVPAGRHEIGLRLTDNCEVRGTNPQISDIQIGATAAIVFEVICSTPAIAFMSNRSAANGGVFVANPDGSALTKLGPDPAITPVWSPDGQKLAFISFGVLSVMNADGSGVRQIFVPGDHVAAYAYVVMMRWSPDSQKLVFEVDYEAYCQNDYCILGQIWKVDADGSGPGKLADGFGPAWSPDGRRIAFGGQQHDEIYAIDSDGTHLTQVTANHQQIVSPPTWSPDGTRLAFASTGGAFYSEILLVNADGTGLVAIPPVGVEERGPQWSSDGSRIAITAILSSEPGQDYVLVVMSADGSGRRVVSQAGTSVTDFIWSPSGRQLAFTAYGREADTSFDVYLVNDDGSGVFNLSNSPSYDVAPTWSAR